MKTVIIIPARMSSQRLPNKPMALICGVPMIQRVWQQAIKSNVGETYVACSEKAVFDLINNLGGNAIMTEPSLPSGTDRIFAALEQIKNFNSFESIINLQGDMPLINPEYIHKANEPIFSGFEIGTLVTDLSAKEEENVNITKVEVEWIQNQSLGKAKDFYKISKGDASNVYQHVGIYSFKIDALKKFVSIPQSENELNLNLEQWRAIDSGIDLGVYYVEDVAISVDTKEDLKEIENIIKSQ